MCILLLFNGDELDPVQLSLHDVLMALTAGLPVAVSHSELSDLRVSVCSALLSLTAERHPLLLSSDPATADVCADSLAGVQTSLPYGDDTTFRVNAQFSSGDGSAARASRVRHGSGFIALRAHTTRHSGAYNALYTVIPRVENVPPRPICMSVLSLRPLPDCGASASRPGGG
jgi:hypothetical protein